MDSGITTANMLKEFITVIFNKAVQDTASCPIYSKLLSDLNEKLPPLPSLQPGGKEITVKRILSNIFQDSLKAAHKQLIPLGNIHFLGELFKQKLVPEWIVHHILDRLLGNLLRTEYIEALCQLLNSIGKQLDESPTYSRVMNDMHFRRLKQFGTKTLLPSKLKFMVCDVENLRANNWIPLPDSALKMNDSLLHGIVFSFLEKYFSDRSSVDLLKCVNDLKSPDFHPHIVKESIFLGLSRSPPCVEGVVDFLKDLFTNSIFSSKDIVEGCLMFLSPVDDNAIDLPELPKEFGKIIGELVLAGCIDFKAVRDIFSEVVLYNFPELVYYNFLNAISCYNLNHFLDL